MFLEQLFFIYSLCYSSVIFHGKYVFNFYISTFWSMFVVPNMAVFCSSLISYFPAMLLKYCLNDYEMVPVASVITGITFSFTFHMRWILL